jgi:predicted transcriptional regulator
MIASGSSPPPHMHELEAEVMAEVWRQGREVTVRDVMQAINQQAPRERAYTTFMTIMRRLASKALLERRREGKTDHYRARLTEDEYRTARAGAEASALVERYGDAALAAFASEMDRLDPEHRSVLRRLASDA